MIPGLLQVSLLFLLFTSPAFVLPLILGPLILRRYRQDELSRLAGVFTLKPLLATPLWVLMMGLASQFSQKLNPLSTIAPGIVLTLLIVWAFRRSFTREPRTAILFLIVDSLRWLNTLAWLSSDASPKLSSPGVYYIAGLILPNAYAVMALVIMWSRARRQRQLEQLALQRLEQ